MKNPLTAVRGRRGSLVHAWMPTGTRRDLDPDNIPNLVCARKLRGPIVVDEEIDCPVCLDVIENGN